MQRQAYVSVESRQGRSRRGDEQGFTVIELLVTLSVAAVLVGIALPSLRNMVMNNSIAAANNELVASLNYARGEAVADRQAVTLCKSANVTTAASSSSATCDTGSTGYQEGWMVLIAPTAKGLASGKVLKATTPDIASGITINGNTAGSAPANLQVAFNQFGMPATPGTSYIVLCDSRAWLSGGAFARVITINQAGNITSAAGNSGTTAAVTSCTP